MGIRTAVEGALTAARQGGAEREGRRSRHWLGVGALTVLAAAGYTVFALLLNYTFQTSSYDLVIFDQAVRSYAHFEPGISIIKGVHNGFGPHFSVLGDHWSPILAALAPLYWIYNGPQVLLVAQAVLFALAIPPIWVFTRRAFGGDSKATAAAYLVAAAYALSWPIASALDFDFHEVAFAPLLIAVALERLQAGKLRSALIALAILLLVKEDMGLLVAGIGLYLAVARPRTVTRQRLVGGILIAAGVADSVIATYILIPAFGGRSDYYWAYTALGHNVPQAAWHLLTHPAAADLLVTPRVKLYTMLWLFGAFCFLSLRSPIVLATIPLLLERMFANLFPDWWVTSYQYNAYLVVILACAAVDGAARFDRAWQVRRPPSAEGPRGTGAVGLGCAAAMCAVAVVLVPHFAFGAALRPSFYHRDAQENAAAAADAVVPAGVTVQAVDNLGPQLSGRDTVLLWDGDGSTPPLGSSWVVANVRRRQFTFRSLREQERRLALLERNGYYVVFSRDGYIVLHRGGSRPGAADSKEVKG
ncbi:MAG: DUF2079 domain-containing protein [Streptosporangiaceae bacterium]